MQMFIDINVKFLMQVQWQIGKATLLLCMEKNSRNTCMFSLSWNNVEDKCWFKTWNLPQIEDPLILWRYDGITYAEICWTNDHEKTWNLKIEFTFSTQKYIDRSNAKNLKNITCSWKLFANYWEEEMHGANKQSKQENKWI